MRRSTRVVVSVLVVAIVAVTLWRALLYTDSYSFFRANPYYVRTDTRADALLIGALAAQLWVRGRVPRQGLGVGASISVVFLAVCVWSFSGATGNFLYKGGYTLIEIATAVVILALVEQRWSGTRICEWRPLQTVGRVSYGLYLWHLPVLVAVQRYGKHWRLPIRITIALSLIAAFTAASWYLVEVPMLRRKRPTPQVAEASST
jgi:peptidoglycan/LPS O-acetylase OafA/YrhL